MENNFNYENNKKSTIYTNKNPILNNKSDVEKLINNYSFNIHAEENYADEFNSIKSKLGNLKNNIESLTSNLHTDFDELEKKLQNLIDNSNLETLDT